MNLRLKVRTKLLYFFRPLIGQEKVTSSHVWRVTSKKKLPHICIYIAWFLCIVAIVCSAFFTFMYR